MTNETQVMPAVALRGITILPDMIVHFDVSRKKSIRAIEEAMTKDQRIFLITQKDPKVEEPSEDDLYKIGTVAMIKQVAKVPKDMLRVLVEGMERAELMQLEDGTSYLEAEVDVMEQEEENLPDTVKEAMLLSMRELFSVYCKENQKMNQEQVRQTLEIDDITDLVDHIAVNIPLTFKQRQQILESTSFSERYEILGVILSNEIEVMRLRTEIQEKVKQRIDKNQRDYILREQLKLIREELGEDDTVSDGDHFMQEAEKLQAPKEIKERLIKEIRRFKSLGYNNSESSVSRGYIETLLKLPWEKASRDNRNLDKASQILEADHYGLEKVKERVLEFLAVRTLTKKGSSPILCLVGPPGTGKTMGAQVIANQLHMELYKIQISQVVSKYIGETEKNLREVFTEARKSNSILFFDECDALFGKRASEVKDSNDRNANMETAYLLQQVEDHDGVTIMATNLLQNIDPAFMRRIGFVVHFPFPEKEMRERLYHGMLPAAAPVADDVDFAVLAERFKVSGGGIKNIVLHAAFLAAEEDAPICMRHLVRSAVGELRKNEIVVVREDLREYADLAFD